MNGAAAPVWNILTLMCFWFWKIFSFKKVDLQSDRMLQGSSVRHISEQHRKLLLKVTWFLNFVNSWTWTLPVFTSSVVFMFRKAEHNLFGNNKRCWCNPFCLSAGKTSGLPWTWRDSAPSLASVYRAPAQAGNRTCDRKAFLLILTLLGSPYDADLRHGNMASFCYDVRKAVTVPHASSLWPALGRQSELLVPGGGVGWCVWVLLPSLLGYVMMLLR